MEMESTRWAEFWQSRLNNEKLETIFIGVESLVINARLLTTVSDDPNDNLGLTPNYFLIGQMGLTL